MAYFPNLTAWEYWAAKNCFCCSHWPKDDGEPACPIDTAHNLYGYELCNETDHPGKVILDLLIPHVEGELGADECAMFHPLSEEDEAEHKRLAEQSRKYAEAMRGQAA